MLTIPLDNEKPSFFLVHLKWRERTRVRESSRAREENARLFLSRFLSRHFQQTNKKRAARSLLLLGLRIK